MDEKEKIARYANGSLWLAILSIITPVGASILALFLAYLVLRSNIRPIPKRVYYAIALAILSSIFWFFMLQFLPTFITL